MIFHKIVLLALGVFIFTLSAGLEIAESQFSEEPANINAGKKWDFIEGFRSAKFGMDERKVRRAIARDFKLSKSKVKLKTQANNKTTALNIEVDNLIPIGGAARIGYVLGYKSKRLMQVNIVWGLGITKEKDAREVVALSNILRRYFQKKRFVKKSVKYEKVNPTHHIPFVGRDKKGRTIKMDLLFPQNKAKKNAKGANRRILKISYIGNPDEPDVYKALKAN